jgi:hypothetical protein
MKVRQSLSQILSMTIPTWNFKIAHSGVRYP